MHLGNLFLLAKTGTPAVHTFSRVQLALFSISVLILTLLQTQSMQLCKRAFIQMNGGKKRQYVSLILRMQLK